MLKSGISEGLLPDEIFPVVQFHESVHRPVNLLLEDDRIVTLVPPCQFRLHLV
jgi:hypothetical protein